MQTQSEAPTPAVAIIASAGGLAAISRVLSGLPDDLDAAVIVVMHLLPEHRSMLTQLLRRNTDLQVKTVESGDAIRAGWVYVAPPDAHVLVDAAGCLRLDTGPPLHHLRPSGDMLFDSLSDYDGRRLAVVLTGSGTDGASGAKAVREAGGRVLVQDPDSSEHGGMPNAAIAAGAADGVISLEEMASAIRAFVSERQG